VNAGRSLSQTIAPWLSTPQAAARTILIGTLPLVILVVSPQRVTISLAVTAVYVLAAIWLRRIGKADRLTILFATVSAGFLALSLLRAQLFGGLTPAQKDYATFKAFYVIAVVLPLGAAVAVIVQRVEEIRPAAVVFLVASMIVSLLTVGLCNPGLFGEQRYVWQGNLAALGALIGLQFWVLSRFWPALVAGVVALLGVAAANSRESVVAVAIGLLLTSLYWYLAERRRSPANPHSKRRTLSPLILVVVWLSLLAAWTIVDLQQSGQASGLNWLYNPAGQCGRIAGRFAALSESTGGRTELLVAGLKQVASNPLLGTGLGSYLGRVSGYPYPHNVPLEVAGEMGLVGVAILLGPLVLGWGRLIATGIRLRSGAIATLMVIVLAFAASASLSGDLPSARPLFIFGMLALKFGFAPTEPAPPDAEVGQA
jgi:O-antigen ligase